MLGGKLTTLTTVSEGGGGLGGGCVFSCGLRDRAENAAAYEEDMVKKTQVKTKAALGGCVVLNS